MTAMIPMDRMAPTCCVIYGKLQGKLGFCAWTYYYDIKRRHYIGLENGPYKPSAQAGAHKRARALGQPVVFRLIRWKV